MNLDGDEVILKNKLKNLIMITALSLGVTFTTASYGTMASADSGSDPAQQLVDALHVLDLDHIDYLYAYLQTIDLSERESSQLAANTERSNQIIRNTDNLDELPKASKVELLRLFMENIKFLQLKAVAVDDYGRKINLVNYEPGTTGVKIQLKDRSGNLLATLDPTREDLAADVLLSKINALLDAVEALEEISASGTFVPMPSAKLPDTATELPAMIAMGGLLIIMGGAALVPAVVISRKSKKTAEAK